MKQNFSSQSTSVLSQIKELYLIWLSIAPHFPKTSRFTLGMRIENKLLDLLEMSYLAYFSEKSRKIEMISECIVIVDTSKYLLSVAWQAKLISNKGFEDISMKLVEIGKILGGWKRLMISPVKKNLAHMGEEK